MLLKHTITQGWPNNIKEVTSVIQSYCICREELTIEDGIILKGTRIAIPAKKWGALPKLIHEGLLGLNKCKLHVEETAYWPRFNDQLEKLYSQLLTVIEILTSKMQVETYHVFGTSRFHHTLGPS